MVIVGSSVNVVLNSEVVIGFINYIFLNPTDEIEVKNIMLFLNPSKAIGPNNIPNKILKSLINVSSQLTELFNLSFFRGVFSLILKTSKIIPVYNKDSKIKCSNTG